MVFSYDDRNDDGFYNLYRFSWIIVFVTGLLGILYFVGTSDIDLSIDALKIFVDDFAEIARVLLIVSSAALVVGWFQVAFAAKLGEEVVLLVTWLTPFAVMLTSVYIYSETEDINYLGGLVAGFVFLVLVIYFRKSLRLSARMIEVGAEISAKSPTMFIPQLTAFVGTVVVTILMMPGVALIGIYTVGIHPIITIILISIYLWLYGFIIAAFQAFADASNISFVDYWYSKTSNASLGKAAEHVKKQKAPIVRFAFLMAFINRFRRNQGNGWSPFRLFELMRFSNWKNVLLGNKSLTNRVADTAAYFGSYTLVVLMVKNSNSVADAYKESAKTVFKRFAENIAGSMGFNILESLRKFISGILMLVAGGMYGYITYGDFIMVIVFALLFFILGFYPLNSMFKPAVNAYRVILYRGHTGKISKKLDDKTQELMKEVLK